MAGSQKTESRALPSALPSDKVVEALPLDTKNPAQGRVGFESPGRARVSVRCCRRSHEPRRGLAGDASEGHRVEFIGGSICAGNQDGQDIAGLGGVVVVTAVLQQQAMRASGQGAQAPEACAGLVDGWY